MGMNWTGEAAISAARQMAQQGLGGAAQQLLEQSAARAPIESGALRASGQVRQEGLSASVVFSADHGLFVHEGTARMPGRPFLRESVGQIDLVALVARVLNL